MKRRHYERQPTGPSGLPLGQNFHGGLPQRHPRYGRHAHGAGLQSGGHLFHRPDPRRPAGGGGVSGDPGVSVVYGGREHLRRWGYLCHLPGHGRGASGLRKAGFCLLHVELRDGGAGDVPALLGLYGSASHVNGSQRRHLGLCQGLPVHCGGLRSLRAHCQLLLQRAPGGGPVRGGYDGYTHR